MQEVEVTMAMNICRGSFAALNVDAVREFDIVEILSGVDLSDKERVVTVRFWQRLQTGGSWYIQTEATEVVRVMHIVNPDVQMLSITEDNMLPKDFHKEYRLSPTHMVVEQDRHQINSNY